MIVLIIGVVVALLLTLRFFFGRLSSIQRTRWGEHPHPDSELSFTEAMQRLRNLSLKKNDESDERPPPAGAGG